MKIAISALGVDPHCGSGRHLSLLLRHFAMIDNTYHDISRSIEMGNMGRKIVIKKLSKRGYLDLWERLLQDTIQAFRKNTISSAI